MGIWSSRYSSQVRPKVIEFQRERRFDCSNIYTHVTTITLNQFPEKLEKNSELSFQTFSSTCDHKVGNPQIAKTARVGPTLRADPITVKGTQGPRFAPGGSKWGQKTPNEPGRSKSINTTNNPNDA